MRALRALAIIIFSLVLTLGLLSFGSTARPDLYRFFFGLAVAGLFCLWVFPVRRLLTLRSLLLPAVGVVVLVGIVLAKPVGIEGYLLLGCGWVGVLVGFVGGAGRGRRDGLGRDACAPRGCGSRAGGTALAGTPVPPGAAAPGRVLFLLLMGLGLLEAFYGLVQSIGGFDYIGEYQRELGRVASGTFINRNHFAGLLNMAIPLALGALYATFPRRGEKHRSEGYAWAWIIILVCGFMGLAILLSLSRGGTLSLIASVVFLSVIISLKGGGRRRRTLSGRVGAVLLFVIVGLGLWVGIDSLISRFTVAEGGAGERLIAYRDSLKFIAENPLGVGPGMYQWRFRPSADLTAACWWTHAHNDYLETTAEWGIPIALLLWGFVLWRLVGSCRTFLRSDDLWQQGIALGCAGAIFSILLHSFVDFNLQIPANWVIFCVILGLSWANEAAGAFPARKGNGADGFGPRAVACGSVLLRGLFTLLFIAAGWGVWKQAAAWSIGSEGTVEAYQEALKWAPDDARYHYGLGVIYRDSLDRQNLQLAGKHLEEAVRLNPYDWYHWRELARYYEMTDDARKAETAMLRCLDIRPRNGAQRWRLGNFYVRQGRMTEAIDQIKQAMQLDPTYRQAGLMVLSKAGLSADEVQTAWPQDADSQLMLVRFLAEKGSEPAEISRYWNKYLRTAGQTDNARSQAGFYLRYLYENRRFRELREQWIALNRLAKVEDPDFARSLNLVWNAGFEKDIGTGLLDWTSGHSEDYRVEQLEKLGPDGSRVLRIEFPGEKNLSFSFSQPAVLPGAGSYRFSAMLKSEEISTDQGLFFLVVDSRTGARLAATEQVRGTTGWTKYEAEFRAPEGSEVVSLSLRRTPSRKFDNKLGGVVWVDQVSLRAESKNTIRELRELHEGKGFRP